MRWLRQEGQALVEIALTLPILLLLLLGTVEVGRVFHAYIVVAQASREAARAAAVGTSDQGVIELVTKNTSSLGGNVTIEINPAPGEREVGGTVTVEIEHEVDLVAPVITRFFSDPFPVRGATSMRVE